MKAVLQVVGVVVAVDDWMPMVLESTTKYMGSPAAAAAAAPEAGGGGGVADMLQHCVIALCAALSVPPFAARPPACLPFRLSVCAHFPRSKHPAPLHRCVLLRGRREAFATGDDARPPAAAAAGSVEPHIAAISELLSQVRCPVFPDLSSMPLAYPWGIQAGDTKYCSRSRRWRATTARWCSWRAWRQGGS
eukprot:COSAG05_NODE_1123_length_5793_cov_4.158588_5_plen_191_part_00